MTNCINCGSLIPGKAIYVDKDSRCIACGVEITNSMTPQDKKVTKEDPAITGHGGSCNEGCHKPVTNEEIAREIIMKHYNAGFEEAPSVKEEMNDIKEALDTQAAHYKGEIDMLHKLYKNENTSKLYPDKQQLSHNRTRLEKVRAAIEKFIELPVSEAITKETLTLFTDANDFAERMVRLKEALTLLSEVMGEK